MRKFDYRVPRFLVDFPVRLTLEDATQFGRCLEISTEGMKLEVREHLSTDSCGAVHLSYKNLSLDLPVRVANSGPTYDGLRFIFETDEQREDVVRLVALLAGVDAARPGPVLIR